MASITFVSATHESVEQPAKKYSISAYYLALRFKQSIGFRPKQYIFLNHPVYSGKLLMAGHLPVSEVAYKSHRS